MKTCSKLLMGMAAISLLTACHREKNYDGIYTAHIKGEYSVADDTLIVDGAFVTRRTGFQKLRNGRLLPKQYKSRTLHTGSEDFPVMQFKADRIIIGQTIYHKQP